MLDYIGLSHRLLTSRRLRALGYCQDRISYVRMRSCVSPRVVLILSRVHPRLLRHVHRELLRLGRLGDRREAAMDLPAQLRIDGRVRGDSRVSTTWREDTDRFGLPKGLDAVLDRQIGPSADNVAGLGPWGARRRRLRGWLGIRCLDR